MKRISFILALTFCSASALLNGCKPEDPCDRSQTPIHSKYEISKDNRTKIPFKLDGTGTLVYISNEGDTATLIGQGVEEYFTSESKNRNSNPECPLFDSWSYEHIRYSFASDKIQNLTIMYYSNTFEYIEVLINGNREGLLTLNYANNEEKYQDSVIVGSDTLKVIGLNKNPSSIPKSIFYSYKHGIIKIALNGKTWIRKLP